MLIGEYTHSLDDKHRVSLPAKFRKELGKKIIITHGLDSCLFIFSESQWKKFSEQLSSLSLVEGTKRKFSRFMLGGASEVEVDAAGRILIPEFLTTFAKLGERIVFAGVHTRAEIWSESTWRTYKHSVEKDIDVLSEKLGEIGAL